MMKYTSLGRSGLQVSRLCLGTMNFGPHATPEESFAIMDRAHEHGINFFDTADVYGWQKGEGITEKIIGDWFAKGGNRREKTVIMPGADGKKPTVEVTGSVGDSAAIQAAIKDEQWNEYKIIAKGNHVQHFINGMQTIDVTDEDAANAPKEGLIALQIHQGPPMIVQFKNFKLTELK